MTLTASCQINIQLILTLAPAKNLAGKKSYTLRKFPATGKGKRFKLCFQGAQFWVQCKDKIFPGRYLALSVKETGMIGRKLKSSPQKRPVWVWSNFIGPLKKETILLSIFSTFK